jgi:hypothetical protein
MLHIRRGNEKMRTNQMTTILPTTLNNEELIRFSAELINNHSLPLEYQRELLKRFITLADYVEDLLVEQE